MDLMVEWNVNFSMNKNAKLKRGSYAINRATRVMFQPQPPIQTIIHNQNPINPHNINGKCIFDQ